MCNKFFEFSYRFQPPLPFAGLDEMRGLWRAMKNFCYVQRLSFFHNFRKRPSLISFQTSQTEEQRVSRNAMIDFIINRIQLQENLLNYMTRY